MGPRLLISVTLMLAAGACEPPRGVPAPAAPIRVVGPYQPDASPSQWEVIQNAGQHVLPPQLAQAFYQFNPDPNGQPLKLPYSDFVDPIGYTAFHYEGETVRVGLIGCLSGPVKDYSGNMLKGAQLAVDELNAAGGYFGMPFEIITRDDRALMGEDGHRMIELIYDEEVLAILGSMSSDTTHVGIRLSLKTEIPQITSISTDPTITQIIIPWAFRVLADDWSQGRALARLLLQDLGLTRIAILERNNRYGRMGSLEIARVAQRSGRPVRVKLKFDAVKDFTPQLKIVKEYQPDAIVIWSLYDSAALITQQARAMGITAPIFGADGMVSDTYIQLAGQDAEGVVVTFPFNDTLDDPVTKAFLANYEKKYGSRADSFSAHGYDAMQVVGYAIREAGGKWGKDGGLNRTRIRDEIAKVRDLPGATGALGFDHNGNDTRVVEFAVIEGGRFRYLDAERLARFKASLQGGGPGVSTPR